MQTAGNGGRGGDAGPLTVDIPTGSTNRYELIANGGFGGFGGPGGRNLAFDCLFCFGPSGPSGFPGITGAFGPDGLPGAPGPAAGSATIRRRAQIDYTGDGRTDFAIWRPSTGEWWVNGLSGSVHWGLPGDILVPGDYTGDGKTDFAVYRPSEGKWYIRGQAEVQWGGAGDIPVSSRLPGR